MTLAKFHSHIFDQQTIPLEFRLIHTKDQLPFYHFIRKNIERFTGPFPVTTEAVMQGPAATRRWIAQKTEEIKDNKSMVCVAQHRQTGEILLFCSAFGFDWRVPKCEIAWMLDPDFEGLGIATACLKFAIGHLLKESALEKIICRIEPSNSKSIALARRLGFVNEGTHKKDFRDGNGRLVDVAFMAYFASNQEPEF